MDNWPSFLSQPIVPIVLIFWNWFYVLAGVFVLNVMWATIRYRYVNVPLATHAVHFVTLCKWPAALGSGLYLIFHHSYISGLVALGWPLLAGYVGVPGKIGVVEIQFAKAIGYIPPDATLDH